ncbi:MAG: 5'/3'-nucleotidase SurE [Acidimicrobiales bacterium]
MRRSCSALLLTLTLVLVAASCGDDGGSTADPAIESTTTTEGVTSTTVPEAPATTTTTAAPTTTTTAAPEPLLVLVSNDDGVDAPGIDAVVEMLIARGDVEVVVVAPDGNRSGSSDTTTEDGEVTAVEATTASGYPAVAVSGFPADAVIHALDVMGIEPDLVISGINEGANIGPFSELSGTVGAARTGARAGYPALAASSGLGEPVDFPAGAAAVSDWLDDNIEALRDDPAAFVESLNIPSCAEGEVRGVLEVPTATDFAGRDALASDCLSEATDAADDVDAFNFGYASLAVLTF